MPFAKSTKPASDELVITGNIAGTKRSLLSLSPPNPLSSDPVSVVSASSFSSTYETGTPSPISNSLVQIRAIAQNLGSLLGQGKLTGTVSSAKPYDVYQFNVLPLTEPTGNSLTGTGTISVSSTANIVLVEDKNNNGIVDAGEAFEGTSSSPVSRPYSPGTYYVVTYSPGGDLSYTLTLEADFAGNSIAIAADLGNLTSSQQFQDSVSSSDQDYYRFSVTTPGNLTLLLNGLTADANVQLIQDLNNNGLVEDTEILQASTNPGNSADAIVRSLTPGNYFIRVLAGASESTNYTLSLFLDEAGNSLSAARNLNLFSGETRSLYDFVGTSDPEDYYSFTLSADSNFSLLLNSPNAAAAAQLIQDLNSNGVVDGGEVVATSITPTGTSFSSISRSLTAGTYFVRVLPNAPAPTVNTNYRLDLSLTIGDAAGNSLTNAQTIGLSSIPSPFTDWVDSADPDDYYRVTLISPSTLNLVLDSLSADANLQLIQDLNGNGVVDSNEVLQTSANPGLAAETISQLLNPGTYFVRVYQATGATNFRLTASAIPFTDQAGDNFNDARLVNLNSTVTPFDDRIGNGDLNDYYRFTIANDGSTLNLLLSGLSVNTIAELIQDFNGDGVLDSNEILDVAVNQAASAATLSRVLNSGTYYVRILAADPNAATNYSLSLSLDLAGNTPSTARFLSPSDTPITYSDWVGSADTIDYYRINLSTPTNLSLVLNGLTADASLRVLDSFGNLIQDSVSAAGGGRSLDRISTPGTYLIEVVSQGNTNYNLQVTTPAVDNAGNTLATALDLGAINGAQVLSDFISNSDTNDFYRFSVDALTNLNVQLTGLSADANLFLIRDLNNDGIVDSNELIQSSINPGVNPESITQSLTPGTYFLQVVQGEQNTSTSYSLILYADQAGDTISTARDITVDNTNRSFSDFISAAGSDNNDYYRFTLATNQTFNLALTTLGERAAVQLVQDLNGDGIVQDNEVVLTQATDGTAPITLSQALAAGTYLLRVLPNASDANYTLTVSNSAIDGFGLNLHDLSVINLARAAFSDSQLSRDEVLSILRSTKDSGIVTQTELTDLRLLVANGQLLGMPDYVKILADRVVNVSAANQFYQGSRLGSLLSSGDTATKLEQLISKWFLGSDRPLAKSTDGQTTYTYRLASGSLFQNGVSYTDIRQGDLEDCYLLAGLAATAFRLPNVIQNMFIDNGDGTYTVRFYNNGVADYVTVDRYLPTTALGTLAYAGFDNFYNSTSNELWVALAEKAYAQISQLGWTGQDNTNSYQGIATGLETIATRQITNLNATGPNPINFTELVNAFNAGQLVYVDSNPATVASNIVPNHEYVVVGFDPTTLKLTLFNPWGVGSHQFSGSDRPGIVQVSEAELLASFTSRSYTTPVTA